MFVAFKVCDTFKIHRSCHLYLKFTGRAIHIHTQQDRLNVVNIHDRCPDR